MDSSEDHSSIQLFRSSLAEDAEDPAQKFPLKREAGLWVASCGKRKHCKENPRVYLKAFMLLSPRLESYSYSQLLRQE